MSELEPFFPKNCALQYQGSTPILLRTSSGRNYKKSFRYSADNINRLCQALTSQLTQSLPTLEEAINSLDLNEPSHKVFGLSGKFYVRTKQKVSVPCIYYMDRFIGYCHEGQAVVSKAVSPILLERLVKNSGGYNVIVEP